MNESPKSKRQVIRSSYYWFTRREILSLIATKCERGDEPTISLATFRQILLKTQKDGYGSNYGELADDRKVSATAVPIGRKNGSVIGCVNVVGVTRAIETQQLASRFLAPLREAAILIERLLPSD